MQYDCQERREDVNSRIIEAIVISAVGTILPGLLAGALVGLFFKSSFWYWTLGIAAIAIPWVLMNRVHVRFYRGFLNGKSLTENLKYAYSSTDCYPNHSLFGGAWWSWYWGFFRRHF